MGNGKSLMAIRSIRGLFSLERSMKQTAPAGENNDASDKPAETAKYDLFLPAAVNCEYVSR